MVRRFAAMLGVPAVDLGLQLVAPGQQGGVAGREGGDDGGEAGPEGAGGEAGAGQGFVLHEVFEDGSDLNVAGGLVVHREISHAELAEMLLGAGDLSRAIIDLSG